MKNILILSILIIFMMLTNKTYAVEIYEEPSTSDGESYVITQEMQEIKEKEDKGEEVGITYKAPRQPITFETILENKDKIIPILGGIILVAIATIIIVALRGRRS